MLVEHKRKDQQMDVKNFLEDSLLPTLTALLSVTKTMAETQVKEHREIKALIGKENQRNHVTEQAVQNLLQSVNALQKPITQLVTAVNESNQLQLKQNQQLSELFDTVAENTARLNTLNIALYEQDEDPGIKAIYDALKKEKRA